MTDFSRYNFTRGKHDDCSSRKAPHDQLSAESTSSAVLHVVVDTRLQ